MAMTFALKMTVTEANYVKRLLEQDKARCEKWITATLTTPEEVTKAQTDYSTNERLLRQF